MSGPIVHAPTYPYIMTVHPQVQNTNDLAAIVLNRWGLHALQPVCAARLAHARCCL